MSEKIARTKASLAQLPACFGKYSERNATCPECLLHDSCEWYTEATK